MTSCFQATHTGVSGRNRWVKFCKKNQKTPLKLKFWKKTEIKGKTENRKNDENDVFSQLVWSVWNRDNSSSQVFIANTPFLSCTHTLYKGDGLINSFSFLGGSLFMLDRSNMQIFMIQKIPGREASWTQIPDVARVMPHFNVSQALSMHMNDVSHFRWGIFNGLLEKQVVMEISSTSERS